MTTPVTVKEIRILLGFNQLTDEEVVTQCFSNITGFTGNLNYQVLPVTLANFSAAVSQFQADITAAGDGSKKAIAAKNKQRKLVIQMLKQLAIYVETNSNDDLAIVATSGFVPASTTRGKPQLLGQPDNPGLAQGASGQMLVTLNRMAGATSYTVRSAVVTAGVPGTWTEQTVANLVHPTPVNGLTPGATYAFQVRALGSLGFSPWSDSSIRMTI